MQFPQAPGLLVEQLEIICAQVDHPLAAVNIGPLIDDRGNVGQK